MLVTSGVYFIDLHLLDTLVHRGVLEDIQRHLDAGRIEFHHGDMRELSPPRPGIVQVTVAIR